MTEANPSTSDLSRQGLGLGMVLVAAIFVSLIPITAKISYQEGANPLAVITLRALLGMIGLGTYMALRRQGFRIGWPSFRFSAVTGAAQAFGALGIMGAVAYIDISLAILIVFLHPFLIAIVAHFRGESRLTALTASCIAVALLGLALALAVSFDRLNTTGIGLALLGAAAATVMVLTIFHATKQVGAIAANFYMTVWASLYLVLAAILGPALGLIDAMAFPLSSKGWIGILTTGVAFSLGYVLFFAGAAVIGTTRASVLSIIEPILTILLAILLVNEWLSAIQWLGVALVVASLLVIEMPRSAAQILRRLKG